MLGWELPPHNSGGLGVACHALAKALHAEHIDVTFVLPKKAEVPGDLSRVLFTNFPLNIKRVDTALKPYVTGTEYERWRRKFGSDLYGPTLFDEVLRYADAIEDLIQGEDFDVIHAHDWLSFLAGLEAKRVLGKPLVLHVHASNYELGGGQGVDPRIYEIEKRGMDAADAVITVSHHTREIVERFYHIDPAKIHVIYNGIDPQAHLGQGAVQMLPCKQEGVKIVLYVGRLTLHKGPDHFLRAARKVLEYEPNTRFIIAGSGDMEWQMVRLASELGMADKVLFAGFARDGERDRLYQSADLFVLPSVAEPFGLTPLESLVNGTPVLVSKQSGVSEVLKHALKVDFWDVDEMAHKMIMALRYPSLNRQLAEQGLLDALKLTWKKAAEGCVNLYQKLTSNFKLKNANQ